MEDVKLDYTTLKNHLMEYNHAEIMESGRLLDVIKAMYPYAVQDIKNLQRLYNDVEDVEKNLMNVRNILGKYCDDVELFSRYAGDIFEKAAIEAKNLFS